jgi:hypothetical protein
MDFRKELAKELGLGAIAENTMLDDYVKACEAIAVRYHEIEVKKFRLGAVSGSFTDIEIDDVWTACSRIKADKGHLLNKSTEWNNAYQEGFEACFEWLKNYS